MIPYLGSTFKKFAQHSNAKIRKMLRYSQDKPKLANQHKILTTWKIYLCFCILVFYYTVPAWFVPQNIGTLYFPGYFQHCHWLQSWANFLKVNPKYVLVDLILLEIQWFKSTTLVNLNTKLYRPEITKHSAKF